MERIQAHDKLETAMLIQPERVRGSGSVDGSNMQGSSRDLSAHEEVDDLQRSITGGYRTPSPGIQGGDENVPEEHSSSQGALCEGCDTLASVPHSTSLCMAQSCDWSGGPASSHSLCSSKENSVAIDERCSTAPLQTPTGEATFAASSRQSDDIHPSQRVHLPVDADAVSVASPQDSVSSDGESASVGGEDGGCSGVAPSQISFCQDIAITSGTIANDAHSHGIVMGTGAEMVRSALAGGDSISGVESLQRCFSSGAEIAAGPRKKQTIYASTVRAESTSSRRKQAYDKTLGGEERLNDVMDLQEDESQKANLGFWSGQLVLKAREVSGWCIVHWLCVLLWLLTFRLITSSTPTSSEL